MSVAQAERIKAVCNALDDYDKRAIEGQSEGSFL